MKLRSLLVSLLTVLWLQPVWAETLLIAGGAGYKRPLAEISAAFENYSGIKVEQIYGHMGHVLAQAKQTGQVAVVFGDLSYLEKSSEVAYAGFVPVGEGRLVVAWPRGGQLGKAADIVAPQFARIAVADTKAAIYGNAAMEFFQRSGLESQIKDRLRVVPTVPQVSAYLVSGEVDAGFINLTEALALKDKIGGYLEIDRTLYSPIRIVGAIVKGFEGQASVKRFHEFLTESPQVKAILVRYGI